MTWEEVDQEQLEKLYYEQELSDNEIAKLYRVTRGQVQYKRKKYGILAANKFSWYLSREDDRILGTLNQGSRERLCKKENIDGISKALTHYIFRNGPVEDMHAAGKLDQEDMKTLNKYMVNRIAGILSAVEAGEWLKLELLYAYYQYFGGSWDEAEPDKQEMEQVYQKICSNTPGILHRSSDHEEERE